MAVVLRGVLEKRSREGNWIPQTFEVRGDQKLSYYAGGGLSKTLDFKDVLKIERKNSNTLILWMDGASRHQLRRPEDAPATGPTLDDFERECRSAHGLATAAARAARTEPKPRPPVRTPQGKPPPAEAAAETPAAPRAATPMSRGVRPPTARKSVTFRTPTHGDYAPLPSTPEGEATTYADVQGLRLSAERGFERLLSPPRTEEDDGEASSAAVAASPAHVGSVEAARARRVATEQLVKQALKVHAEEHRRVSPEARRELAREHDAELSALDAILTPQIKDARDALESVSTATPDGGESAGSLHLKSQADSLQRAMAGIDELSPSSTGQEKGATLANFKPLLSRSIFTRFV